MSKGILILFLIFFSIALAAQDSTHTYSKWQIKTAAGLNFPITSLLSNRITDNLLEYDDNSFYWQVISATYFFSAKWGLDYTYHAEHSNAIFGRNERFYQELEEVYGDTYFISPTLDSQFNNFTWVVGSFGRGHLGIVYRYEKSKFIFLPKFSIGGTTIHSNRETSLLKQRGKILYMNFHLPLNGQTGPF